jgi:hypothetical protein
MKIENNQVNYAKQKQGLVGGVEVKLKGLANALDSQLDDKFSSYKRVNEQYICSLLISTG